MALVSISTAAKLAGISRTALYKSYINARPPKLPTTRDERGKPAVDTAELVRVFGKLRQASTGLAADAPAGDGPCGELRLENRALRERVRELQEEKRRQLEEKDRLFARLEAAQQQGAALLALLGGKPAVAPER